MDVYGREAIDNLRTTLSLTFGVSLFAISLLGWYLSGKVLKPIANIVNEVSRISEANLDLRLHEGDEKDELSQLAETFNRMLARLQSAFSSQRSFIANASHELRTPITIMTSEIEVTLLNDRDTTYYRESLHSVLKTLKRMNDLSTRLLMLAHSSAEVTNRTFMPVRIDDVLWEAKQRLASLNPEFVVDVSFAVNINDEALLVNCDEQLMGIALVNLMDNGCKYSPDHRVIVQLTTSHKDKITISFINAGKHIGEDETEMLFQPFFRRSSDKSKKGFGIGLSLIGSIINLHNGQIKVLSEDGMINFVVTLPNSRPQQDIVHV
jgi:signal transduction histidine kinase